MFHFIQFAIKCSNSNSEAIVFVIHYKNIAFKIIVIDNCFKTKSTRKNVLSIPSTKNFGPNCFFSTRNTLDENS